MAANITDLFDRVSDSNTGRPIIADLASPGKAIGASSLNLAAATNWTTESAVHFSIYETTTVGSTTIKDSTTQTDWKGTLSGTTIGNLTITGGTDRAYTAGAKVEITPTSRWAKDLYDGITVGHNQNGTHKAFTESNIVPTAAIQDSAVTTAKINDAAITPTKRTGGFKSGAINASTFSTTGSKAITGVGFRPKFIRVYIGFDVAATGAARECIGVSDGTSTFVRGTAISGSSTARWGVPDVLINIRTEANSSVLVAEFTAFTADGFNLNVTTADSSYSGYYEAFA